MVSQDMKKKDKARETRQKSKGLFVIPYVKGISEAMDRVFRKHGIVTTIRPYCTLRNLLVHPKDKTEKQKSDDKTSECVYSVPCQTCEKVYTAHRKLRIFDFAAKFLG